MDEFVINGIVWRIEFVPPDSLLLYDRTNTHTVATTDPILHRVYISTTLGGDFLRRVLAHELGHCIMVSYNMLDYIRHMTKKEHWVEMEEWVCNFLADFSSLTQTLLDHILRRY